MAEALGWMMIGGLIVVVGPRLKREWSGEVFALIAALFILPGIYLAVSN